MNCPTCRAPNAHGREFCSSCGVDLATGRQAVPRELLTGTLPEPQQRRNPLLLAVAAAGVVGLVAAAVVGLRAVPPAASSDLPHLPDMPMGRMFSEPSARMSVRLKAWTPIAPREYRAILTGQASGTGKARLDPSEFVVVDPPGPPHAAVIGSDPDDVPVDSEESIRAVYRLPDTPGQYELVWNRHGRKVGGWQVGRHRCDREP